MNQKKIKRIRRIAKRIAKTLETTYNVGEPRVDYHGEPIKTKDGGMLRAGMRLQAGVPTTMKKDCVKYITKQMVKMYD